MFEGIKEYFSAPAPVEKIEPTFETPVKKAEASPVKEEAAAVTKVVLKPVQQPEHKEKVWPAPKEETFKDSDAIVRSMKNHISEGQKKRFEELLRLFVKPDPSKRSKE